MSKHTPGPWRIGAQPPNGELTIGTEQGLMVAVATTGLDMPTEANARLIAAAPDLLEALERIANMDSMSYHSLESAKITARAAIAKATGGQQ